MKRIDTIGQITVEHSSGEAQKYNGAEYFRRLVKWMDARNEHLNKDKSTLQLMKEFNKIY